LQHVAAGRVIVRKRLCLRDVQTAVRIMVSSHSAADHDSVAWQWGGLDQKILLEANKR